MRNKPATDNRAKNNRNARISKRMDAKCNALGFLASCDEMSRFTPNLYDNIFIFKPKKKEDAIAEREKFKHNDPIFEEVNPALFEDEFVSVVEPDVVEVAEEVQEEVTPDVVEEQPILAEPVQEEPVQEEQIVEEPVQEEYSAAEQIAKAVVTPVAEADKVEEVVAAQPIPVVIPKPVTKVLVAELQPTPVKVLEPIPVVMLEPISIVTLQPIPVVELEAVEVVALEPVEVAQIVEVVEEAPIVAEEVVEQIVEEPVQIAEEVVEQVIEEVIEEESYVEEIEEVVEEIQPTIPFMAIMIPSSTEEDAELLKERYKTVPLEKRLERGSESVREYYSVLKNELLSYENVKSRLSKKFDTFSIGRFTVAKLTVKNDVVKMYLALANDTIDTKYYTEDVSNSEIYDQTPTLHNVKSKRGLKYGIELIKEIMESIGYSKSDNYEQVDFASAFAPVSISKKKEFIADLMTSTVSVNSCNVITNELAYDMLDIVKSEEYTINKFYPVNKFRIYTDDLVHWFKDGEKVTVATLQEKGALPKVDNLFLEVHGRGVIDRKLFVEAHSYDMKAIKMILLTDGEVIQYK